MEMLERARGISAEFADWIQGIAEQPFNFADADPILHSRHSHQHLWMLERMADQHKAIDLAFRCQIVSYIFGRWAVRLRSYAPYQTQGYRFYLYEDMAPTVSVVAETPQGFPYPGEPNFVSTTAAIMQLYLGRSWQGIFQATVQKDEYLLDAIERESGSIGSPTANRLGVTTAQLRREIECADLGETVNQIRKRFGRRPAQFQSEEALPLRYKILELRLPARYQVRGTDWIP